MLIVPEEKPMSFASSCQSPEGRTGPEIEAYLELSRPTVMKILNTLRAAGQIVRSGEGRSVRYHAGEPKPAAFGCGILSLFGVAEDPVAEPLGLEGWAAGWENLVICKVFSPFCKLLLNAS